ncbi:MAG: cell division topological specificity factor MinE [Anaerolineae bacterium]|nr:cell division topological specificity factor MinE [Anaerolineae bacterium]
MGFWDRLLGRGEPSSREVARERLELVLGYDRAKISPQLLETLKDELINVISQYLEIDRDRVEISLTQDRRQGRLVASIPLRSGRRN